MRRQGDLVVYDCRSTEGVYEKNMKAKEKEICVGSHTVTTRQKSPVARSQGAARNTKPYY